MRKNAIFMAALLGTCVCSNAQADSYDPSTNQLTIDSVQIGNTIYNKVVVTVSNVISIGEVKPASSNVAENCSLNNFTTAAFNAIQEGMTVAQVNQIMGCQYNPSRTLRGSSYLTYIWGITGTMTYVQVWFDATGSKVSRTYPDPSIPFKVSLGF